MPRAPWESPGAMGRWFSRHKTEDNPAMTGDIQDISIYVYHNIYIYDNSISKLWYGLPKYVPYNAPPSYNNDSAISRSQLDSRGGLVLLILPFCDMFLFFISVEKTFLVGEISIFVGGMLREPDLWMAGAVCGRKRSPWMESDSQKLGFVLEYGTQQVQWFIIKNSQQYGYLGA